jgi:polysaccharide biosynthesis transport protein
MADNQLNWQRYLLLIRYHWKFLVLCTLGGVIAGIFTNILILHPMYTSNAKLLIKGGKTPSYVTQLEGDPEIHALTTTGNPLLTQIEVLNSRQLAEQVLDQLKVGLSELEYEQYHKKFAEYFQADKLAKRIKLKNPASTDIITLSINTPNRSFSKLLVDRYIASYQDFLKAINHESLTAHGEYIEAQIQMTEDKLKAVRRELMTYREANQTIDLPNEAQVSIQQVSTLETERINLDSQISARQGNINNLRRQLGMSSQQAIQSVALGMNTALVDSQKALDTALQEYQTLGVKYTDENPTMVALKAKISEIQSQLTAETKRTLGGNAPTRRISDPVRSGLANNLATAEAELQGLRAQRAALAGNLGQLKSQAQQLPQKQQQLSELLDSEKVLSEMLNMLKMKEAEATFQASDSLSNVVVVEAGTFPIKEDFPRPIQVIFLMALMGMMAGLGRLVFLEWLKLQTLRPMQEQLDHRDMPHKSSAYTTQP